jgi:hypothetical protein
MHIGAALVAVGLVAGMYVRGIALRYEAGWESTFLGPQTVHTLLWVLYGPAAAISGIGLPSIEGIRALRWTGASGGGEAASWIHLIALTALLYIVIPRLLLAALSGIQSWRVARNPTMPPALLGYSRALLLGAAGSSEPQTARVTPYSYEPAPDSLRGLETLLAGTLGGPVKVAMREPVRYGDEPELAARLSREPSAQRDWSVLLLSGASTPEAENHGVVISAVRDWLSDSGAPPLLVVVDEAPYAARMGGDATLDRRLRERRSLWGEFVRGYGVQPCIVDLSQVVTGTASEVEAREAARAALWSAGTRA